MGTLLNFKGQPSLPRCSASSSRISLQSWVVCSTLLPPPLGGLTSSLTPPYFAEVGQNCVHQVYQPTPTAPRLFPHLGQPSQGRGDGSWPGGPGQTFARSPPLLPSQISTNCGGPLIGSQGQKPGVQPWGVEEHHQNWPVSFCQFFFQLNMMVNNG